RYFESYEDSPIVAQQGAARARANAVHEEPQEEEDEDMAEIDRYESGEHPDQQQPQEMPRHPYTEDDISAL
ncbi:hypothetical protein A2U01_0108545, partial [Trifolium medium]|nr:hypothetical protein [Trifolium medium]